MPRSSIRAGLLASTQLFTQEISQYMPVLDRHQFIQFLDGMDWRPDIFDFKMIPAIQQHSTSASYFFSG